jgi:hypothetical protein
MGINLQPFSLLNVLKLSGKLQCRLQYDDGDDDRSKMRRVAVGMILRLSIAIEPPGVAACSINKTELSTDS